MGNYSLRALQKVAVFKAAHQGVFTPYRGELSIVPDEKRGPIMTRQYSKKNCVNTQRYKIYVHSLESEIQQLVEDITDMLEAQAELENRPELIEERDLWPELVQKRRPSVPPILAEFEHQISLIRSAHNREPKIKI